MNESRTTSLNRLVSQLVFIYVISFLIRLFIVFLTSIQILKTIRLKFSHDIQTGSYTFSIVYC
jgi:hypothetical protein